MHLAHQHLERLACDVSNARDTGQLYIYIGMTLTNIGVVLGGRFDKDALDLLGERFAFGLGDAPARSDDMFQDAGFPDA